MKVYEMGMQALYYDGLHVFMEIQTRHSDIMTDESTNHDSAGCAGDFAATTEINVVFVETRRKRTRNNLRT